MREEYKIISNLIKAKRLSLNETQEEFARRFDVKRTSLANWEAGKITAPYRVLLFCLDVPKTVIVEKKSPKYIAFKEIAKRLEAIESKIDALSQIVS